MERIRIVFASCGFVLLAPLLTLACGKDSRPAPAPVEREVTTLTEAYCAYLERCHPQALTAIAGENYESCLEWPECSGRFHLYEVEDADACIERLTDGCPFPLERSGGGLDLLGPIHLNIPSASPCDAKAHDYSDAISKLKALGFAAAPGEACIYYQELSCELGSVCRYPDEPRMVSGFECGICEKLPDQVGEPCSGEGLCSGTVKCQDGKCVEGWKVPRTCKDDSYCMRGACREGVCTQVGVSGKAGELPQGGDCWNDEDCDDWALACVKNVCMRRGKAGDPCEAMGNSCQFGLKCESENSGPSAYLDQPGICASDACVEAETLPCSFTGCPEDELCDEFCHPKPDIGERCNAFLGCLEGAACSVDKVCVPAAAEGMPCTSGDDCLSGHCLDEEEDCVLGWRDSLSKGACASDNTNTGVCRRHPTSADCE